MAQTPEQKAKELVDKMYLADKGDNVGYVDTKIAKQCALIAVDEILNCGLDNDAGQLTYFSQVKEEINQQ